MMKVDENITYDIMIPDEDINKIAEAALVLDDIYQKMNNYSCETLEGGYEDCPSYISIEDIFKAKIVLSDFLNDEMDKMY